MTLRPNRATLAAAMVKSWGGSKMARGRNELVQVFLLRALKLALGAVAALALTSPGHAQDYPSKPVRIVVSFAAGGPTDTVARVIGAKLGELLGQQFFVENKAGAGGNLGADLVAKSPPDGYTLLMATVSTHP